MSKVIKKEASIIWPNKGVDYKVCKLVQYYSEDGFSFEYIPDYFVLSLIDEKEFDGIQGIDLDLKKDSYRFNFIPVFIYERVPPRNRVNINEILIELGLDYYDPLEMLFRTKKIYFGDSLKVIPYKEESEIEFDSLTNSNKIEVDIENVIKWIASGGRIEGINDENRKLLFNVYMKLYLLNYHQNKKRKTELDNIVGRPKFKLDEEFLSLIRHYKEKNISLDDAIKLSGVSKSTFIRRMRESDL